MHLDKFNSLINQINENVIVELTIAETLESNQIQTLCTALETNTSVEVMVLKDFFFPDLAIPYLINLLKENKAIEKLTLHRLGISEFGIQQISSALKNNKTLSSLSIFLNDFTLVSTEALAESLKINRSLTHLSLCGCDIDQQKIEKIADMLKVNASLQRLALNLNPFGSAGAGKLAEALRVNKTLNSLFIPSCNIGNAGAKAIFDALSFNNSTLIDLSIAQNGIDDAGLDLFIEQVSQTKLEYLDLSVNPINILTNIIVMMSKNTRLINLKLPALDYDPHELNAISKQINSNIAIRAIVESSVFIRVTMLNQLSNILLQKKSADRVTIESVPSLLDLAFDKAYKNLSENSKLIKDTRETLNPELFGPLINEYYRRKNYSSFKPRHPISFQLFPAPINKENDAKKPTAPKSIWRIKY